MRDLFVLSYEDCDDLEAVTHYEMADFDLRAFWTGEPFSGVIPSAVRLWVGNGAPSDHLANPLSWQIVSNRFLTFVKSLVAHDSQLVSVPLYYRHSGMPVSGYVLLNTTRRLAVAVPSGKRPQISIGNLVLDADKVPPDVHVFRLVESPTIIIVSDALVDGVRGKGLRGLTFLKTRRP